MKTLINLKRKYYDRHPHRRPMNGTTTGTSAMSKNFPSVNIQEATLEEARESLREAVQLIIESNNAPKKNTATP
jgi:hypothetical protein